MVDLCCVGAIQDPGDALQVLARGENIFGEKTAQERLSVLLAEFERVYVGCRRVV